MMGSHCDITNAQINTLLTQQLHHITEQIFEKAKQYNHNELVRMLVNNEQMILSYLINHLTNAGSIYARELTKLIQIDASFSNLQTGNYGICSDCDCPISSELLQETPYRQRCRTCLVKYLASPNRACNATIKPATQQ